jgi:nucleotide-binding universal stress UspA family protein
MLLRNILVPIDGAENAERTLDFALGLAEKFGSDITILNVSEVLPMGVVPEASTAYYVGDMALFAKDLRKIHEEILSKAVSYAKASKPDLVVSSVLIEGDPGAEIVNFAKERQFEAIVVGHKGLSKMSERVLGSTSEKVAHLAPCPVVIVR